MAIYISNNPKEALKSYARDYKRAREKFDQRIAEAKKENKENKVIQTIKNVKNCRLFEKISKN